MTEWHHVGASPAEDDPGQPPLGETPSIHPHASVRDCWIGPWTKVGARTTIAESRLGAYSYIVNDGNVIYADIGRFCSIAAQVRINPGNHPTWRAGQHHFIYRAESYQLGEDEAGFFDWRREHRVTIGPDVWIGHGAIVLPGTTIGAGTVIAAGAVVRGEVEPYTVVGGVPARMIRRRFEPAIAAALMAIAWWDWPRERLRDALDDFRTLAVEAFIEKHRR